MRYLRQSTAATVAVGAFVDKTTALALTALTDQSANGRLIKGGTGASFTAASWAHDGGGHYLVGLSTAHTDTVGRLRLAFALDSTYLPTWEDFSVLSAAVYDVIFGTVAPSTHTAGAVQALVAAGAVASVTGSVASVAGSVGSVAGNVGGNVVGSVGSVVGSVGAVTAAVTVTGTPAVNVTQWSGSAVATPTIAGVPEVDVTHMLGAAADPVDVGATADLVDLIWDEPQSGHATAGTFGKYLDATTSTLATATALATLVGYVDTEVAAIKLRTDNLPSDTAAEVAAIKAVTDQFGFDAGNVNANVMDFDATLDAGTTPTAAENATATLAAINADAGFITLLSVGVALDEVIVDDGAGAWEFTAGAMANAPTGSGGGSLTAADVWTYTAGAGRVLTAGTNIVLAKGVGVTGLNDLSAAQVNAEADAAIADAALATAAALATVGGKVDAVDDYVDTEVAALATSVAAIQAKTDNLPASPAAVGSNMGTVSSVTGAVGSVTAPVTVSGTVDATLVSTGLDAIPMTLTSAPTNFREWLVWLTLRFRRVARNKTTGAISVYGSDGTTVVTTQTSTDTTTAQTTGVPS